MAIALVTRSQGGGSAVATTIASPAAAVSAANLLVAMFTWGSAGGTFSSIADTAGNTWTAAGSEISENGNRFRIYYAYNCAGHAANVVTVTLSLNATYRSIVVYQFSGALTTNPIGGTAGTLGTGTAINSGSVTVTAAEEVIVGTMIGAPAIVAANGFTLTNFAITGDATAYFADEYKFVTASEAATATQSSGAWTIKAASFKAAVGGGGGGNPWYAYAQQRVRTTLERPWHRNGLLWTPSYALGSN